MSAIAPSSQQIMEDLKNNIINNVSDDTSISLICTSLLEQEEDWTVFGASGYTLLFLLITRNNKGQFNGVLQKLLEKNHQFVNCINIFNKTPLQTLLSEYTFQKISFRVMKETALVLVKAGADVNKAIGQDSLLHTLVLNNVNGCNNQEICDLMQVYQADPNVEDLLGFTPLAILLTNYLFSRIKMQDFIQTAMLLINIGANPAVLSMHPYYTTFMHVLVKNNAENGYINELKLLRTFINICDGKGRTPLQALLEEVPFISHGEVEELIALGANLYTLSSDGYNLLHSACIGSNEQIACYLIHEKNFPVTFPIGNNGTILHLCATLARGAKDAFWDLILTNGVPINAVDMYGATAAHYACINRNMEMINWLTKNNADFSIEDSNGITAYTLLHTMRKDMFSPKMPDLVTEDAPLAQTLLDVKSEFQPLGNSAINALHYDVQTFDKISDLLVALRTMRNYGVKLQTAGEGKGDDIIQIADSLTRKAKDYFMTKTDTRTKAEFELDFILELNSKQNEMGIYRASWATIIANLAIALTGLGFVALAIHLAYTKSTYNRALFFFQKPLTTTETLVDNVSDQFQALVQA